MLNRRTRKIVKIDEDRCNGCGLCVPSCAEGAIRIINGKAKLVAENLCDGLGACLGHCPQDAITVEERPADEFDPAEVERLAVTRSPDPAATNGTAVFPGPIRSPSPHGPSGCPGARLRQMNRPAGPRPAGDGDRPSMLGHWPVQLALVPVTGPIWQDADVLICADCVPFAMAGFHEKLLASADGGRPRTVAIACPKLDDTQSHVAKLAGIFSANSIRSITVAHMQVPCCTGIVRAVHAALQMAGRDDIPVRDVTVNIDGTSD